MIGISALKQALQAVLLRIDPNVELRPNLPVPGIPTKPELVSPLQVKKRSMRTVEGRATLIHALTHIEFNAINLALDAIWRFSDMPAQYYKDWLKVAYEEAYHFSLLNAHLQTLGFTYGDFSGHNSLWEMVDKTKGDVLARMALVPRTMEARGLDALPALRAKLAQAGDILAAEILDITLRDEVGHVSIGNHWFNFLCIQKDLDPLSTFEQLCNTYVAPKLRGPFNLEARRAAGFTEVELARLV
ncbi:MAG: ferritin-like domain-containing protein [Methylotenera sp.]|nr:ferritin-like domain-containing protein [Methylotenera sp.]